MFPSAGHGYHAHGDRRPARFRPRATLTTGEAAARALAAVLLAAPPLAAQSGDAGHARSGGDGAGRDTLSVAGTAAPAGDALSPRVPAGTRRSPDWSPWVTRGLGLATLVITDVGMRSAVQDLRRGEGPLGGEGSVGDEVAEFGNGLGDWQTSLPWIAAGSVALGASVDGLRGAGRGLAVLGGIAAGTMANEALNRAVGRSRPIWGEGAFSFDPFSGHASFPSGHTSLAFSLAGGVDAVTEGWLPATAAYAVAGTSAFARLYTDKHWLSDVVVGAALSATVSRLATRRAMRLLGVADGGEAGGRPAGGRGPGEGSGAGSASEAAAGSRGLTARLLFTPSLLGVQLRF